MFLTDRLARVRLGNLPSSRSEYTLLPRVFRRTWASFCLVSAVLIDFLLLNFYVLRVGDFGGFFRPLSLFFCDLISHGGTFSDQLLILRHPLFSGEVGGETCNQRQVLAVDVHLPLDGFHAPLS